MMSNNALFTREQLAERENVSLATIDFYVSEKILMPVRLKNGLHFTRADLLKLQIIKKGKKFGLSLEEIKLMIEEATPKA